MFFIESAIVRSNFIFNGHLLEFPLQFFLSDKFDIVLAASIPLYKNTTSSWVGITVILFHTMQ